MQISSNKVMLYGIDVAMVLGLLLLISPEFREWLTLDRVIQAVAAGGTVGAVWWAVMHANHLQAEQARRELEIASLHACGFLHDVEDAVKKLQDAIEHKHDVPSPIRYIGRGDETDEIGNERQRIIGQLERLSEALALDLLGKTAGDIALLVALPNRCAHHLHLGIELARRLADLVDRYSIHNSQLDKHAAQAWSWYEEAEQAHQHFSLALTTIVAATSVAKPVR